MRLLCLHLGEERDKADEKVKVFQVCPRPSEASVSKCTTLTEAVVMTSRHIQPSKQAVRRH